MKKVLNCKLGAGSERKSEPRRLGEILHEFFDKSNEPFAVAYRERLFRDIFPDTHLCVDVKTFLRDRVARVGKAYRGVMVRDGKEHFSFFQNAFEKKVNPRHPYVYRGHCINVHRAASGAFYPTFNRPKLTAEFTFADFCGEAAEELLYVARLVKEETM